jgi:hypothetical protein
MSVGLAIASLILVLAAQADTLRLRNGSTFNGSFLGGSADEIRFMVNDEVQRFPRGDVAEVIFSSIGGASVAPPPQVDTGPDVAGVPFLRGATGYIPLEREYGMMARTGGGMYGMGGGTVYRIQGMQSPVRIRQSDRIVFVVRSNGVDPRQFQLYRLEPRMGYRQTQPTMGGMPPSLPMTIKKVGDNVYEITPMRQLYPGEYAVSPMNANQSYCFGVDY